MTDKATLEADFCSYTARNDLASIAGSFTRIAEALVNRSTRMLAMMSTTTLTFSTNTAALPADYRGLISLSPQNKGAWDYLTPSKIREARIWSETWVSENDAAFTIEGLNVIIAPPPSGSPVADLIYWANFAALSAGTDTNWGLTNQYDLYLYAGLHAAYDYIEDDEQSAKYLTKFYKHAREVSVEATKMARGAGMRKTGGATMP